MVLAGLTFHGQIETILDSLKITPESHKSDNLQGKPGNLGVVVGGLYKKERCRLRNSRRPESFIVIKSCHIGLAWLTLNAQAEAGFMYR